MAEHEDIETRGSKRKEKATLLHEQDVKALCATMSTKEGRRTLYRILKTTGWDRPSFTGNSETFLNEGMRRVGLLLRSELQRYCRALYNLMLNENEENGNV